MLCDRAITAMNAFTEANKLSMKTTGRTVDSGIKVTSVNKG